MKYHHFTSISQYFMNIIAMSTLLLAPISPPPAAKVHPADPLKHTHTNPRHQIHVASSVASITNNVVTTAVTRTVPNNSFPVIPIAIFLCVAVAIAASAVFFADGFTFSVPPGTFRRRFRPLSRANSDGTSGGIFPRPGLAPSTATF